MSLIVWLISTKHSRYWEWLPETPNWSLHKRSNVRQEKPKRYCGNIPGTICHFTSWLKSNGGSGFHTSGSSKALQTGPNLGSIFEENEFPSFFETISRSISRRGPTRVVCAGWSTYRCRVVCQKGYFNSVVIELCMARRFLELAKMCTLDE